MNYENWLQGVPMEITGDSLWKMEAYRLALFAADLGWHDVTRLTGDRRTLDLAGQLYRALGSIEANISEGYSRGSGRDRARFYEYALGSARESRGWTKRAMKNRLPVLAAAQKVANELLTLRPKVEMDDGKLSLQKEMVEMSKKISLDRGSRGSEIYDEAGG